MSAPERVVIGDAVLWHARWEAVYDLLPQNGAIVSDVPYGMAWDTDSTRFTGGDHPCMRRGKGRKDWGTIVGDSQPFDPLPWLGFRQCILWGSNHFAQHLPRGTTLVWIKRTDALFGSFLSDAEVAWEKGGHGVYCFRGPGVARDAIGERGVFLPRDHPCQKPVPLFLWCIERTTGLVIDPYAGSFTTAVACIQLGRKFVGCEVEERYFQAGCRRVEAAYQQLSLFPPPAPVAPPTQPTLWTEGR